MSARNTNTCTHHFYEIANIFYEICLQTFVWNFIKLYRAKYRSISIRNRDSNEKCWEDLADKIEYDSYIGISFSFNYLIMALITTMY